MTTRTKDAVVVTTVLLGGTAILVGDLHRYFLAWAWPILTAYLDYLTNA
jgi:hypothetical protein